MPLFRRSFMSRAPMERKPLTPGSRRWLIRELDVEVSRIVRRRDRRCVVCGARQGLQCLHFFPRRYLVLRFDLRNCNAMCAGCNRRHNTDPAPYLAYLLDRYGAEVVAKLDGLRTSLQKVADGELRRLLDGYKA
jgi:hypothetical protein